MLVVQPDASKRLAIAANMILFIDSPFGGFPPADISITDLTGMSSEFSRSAQIFFLQAGRRADKPRPSRAQGSPVP